MQAEHVQMVTITQDNIGGLDVPQQDIQGLDASEFNLRANLVYKEYAQDHVGKTLGFGDADQLMTALRDQAAREVYDQMMMEQLSEDAQERESIRSAFLE